MFELDVILPAKLVSVQLTQPSAERERALAEDRDKATRAEEARRAAQEREEIERVLQNLLSAAGSLRARQDEHLEELQHLAVELAVAIASRLLHEQIEAGEYPVEKLVQQVVERLQTPQPVTVYLHPEDLALLRRRLGGGEAIFPHHAAVQLSADESLARGDVRAEAGDISVTADLQEQLTDIRRNLRETLPIAEKRQSA
jgi:flagellar biosynthesis/type III secretory pathway protein FliH